MKTVIISIQIEEEVDRRVLNNIIGDVIQDITTIIKYTSINSKQEDKIYYRRGVRWQIEIE